MCKRATESPKFVKTHDTYDTYDTLLTNLTQKTPQRVLLRQKP